MLHRRTVQSLVAVLALVAMVCQGTWVLAGTTGALTGIAVDTTNNQPIAGAKITAASASQVASVTTDASGHFTFLSLAPDTYTVSIDAKGFEAASLQGENIAADTTRTLTVGTHVALRTIARVASRASTSLVRPGTTADVYNISPAQQTAVQGVGGGATLNSAYSAVATVPGAYVPQGAQGGNGITPNVYIRGGDYDQVGVEVDGIPINRSFDNYPSGPGASLGQQEVQVYTGAAPANAEGQGLAGFINQTIKIGSYPSYGIGELSIGGPAFYHKGGIEFGGATNNRNFSYYVATDGYNQEFRTADQFNGASLTNLYGTPLANCQNPANSTATAPVFQTPQNTPSCFSPQGQSYAAGTFNPNGAYAFGPYNAFGSSQIRTRNDVVNLHVGIPHKDGTKDDIQFLGYQNFVNTQFYDSTNDQGGATFLNNIGFGVPTFQNSYQYSGPVGVPLPSNYQQLTSIYYYPKFQDPRSGFDSQIPFDLRDSISNDQGILKLQYTKTLGSNALVRLYGYTYYSDWLQFGPQSITSNFVGDASPDYELSSHTRGVSGMFSDQIGSKNLLQFQGSYITSNSLRDNNTQSYNTGAPLAVLVDSNNPTNGICYASDGTPTSCTKGEANISVHQAYQVANGKMPATPITPATGTCGTGPCEYFVVGNGQRATYNTVTPKFYSASLTDQFRPIDKLSIDAGIRLDDYQFIGTDTTATPARTLYFNSYNRNYCVDSTTHSAVRKASFGAACPAGSAPLNLTNPAGRATQTYPEFQPRLGFTYSVNPTTVLRASYGRYTQPPNSAFEQYNYLQQNSPSSLLGFLPLGFTSPNHPVRPQVSNNYDFSVEHSFRGDLSIKVSPFLRDTQDQIQQFYLDQKTGFVSGLNVGRQRSQGVEFELDKGNFAQQGIAAKLSVTYTNSYIRYNTLASGATILDPLNNAIKTYNAYTSFCATHAGDKACGTTAGGVAAAPCYAVSPDGTTAGAPIANPALCTAAQVANPYWNAPVQGLQDPNGNYYPYDLFPGGIGTSADGYGAPYFATFVLQDRIGKFTITPNVQFSAGNRYGAPETTYGVAPELCTATLGRAATGDPRYTSGSPGGGAFDAGTCGQLGGGIPDPFSKHFDAIGAFSLPSQVQLGTQVQYDLTNKVTLTATLTNLVNSCFGGTKTAYNVKGACGYTVVGAGTGGDIGNAYNPGAAIQPVLNAPYLPYFANYPFSVFVDAKVRI